MAERITIEKSWKYRDLDCLVLALDVGHRCGYVRVPQGNRFHALSATDKVPNIIVNLKRPLNESFTGLINVVCGNKEGLEEFTCSLDGVIDIHGGITYSEERKLDGINQGWWIGFDCAHCDDAKDFDLIRNAEVKEIYKNYEKSMAELGSKFQIKQNLWTLNMVVSEVERLADQVANEKGLYEEENEVV